MTLGRLLEDAYGIDLERTTLKFKGEVDPDTQRRVKRSMRENDLVVEPAVDGVSRRVEQVDVDELSQVTVLFSI